MKIHQLEVTNFRRFEQRTFTFSDQFNVLIGENGAGKTALLDALAIAAGSIFLGLEGSAPPPIREGDVRRAIYQRNSLPTVELQFPVRVHCKGQVGGQEVAWGWTLESAKNGSPRSDAQALMEEAAKWARQVRAGQDVTLPLVAYYGTGRLWRLKEQSVEPLPPGSRMQGYVGCLEPASNHKLLVQWFKRMELVQLQQGRKVGQLEVVQSAVTRCMQGWKRVWFDVAEDDLLVEAEDGRRLPFRMLSDGLRNMLAMVADITCRAVVLNPHLGELAAELTSGIVLIDEIDRHLHPRWQRRVVEDLRTTFPQLQFFATTQSPFIIQALRPGELIDLEAQQRTGPPSQSIEDIVEQVMGVQVPQRSLRYQRMMEAAEEYFRVLQEAEGTTSAERREELKRRLDELSEPFSDEIGYHAFLRVKREVTGLGGRQQELFDASQHCDEKTRPSIARKKTH